MNKTITFFRLSKCTNISSNKKTNAVVALVAYRWHKCQNCSSCRWCTSTSAGQFFFFFFWLLLLYLPICSASWTGPADLKLLPLQLCSKMMLAGIRCFAFLTLCVLVVFNNFCDCNFLSNLTSSDPYWWKVQLSALQTYCHWTDTTWWAVICLKSDSALVMFRPIRATWWALSRASVVQHSQWRMATDMSVN